MVVSDKQVNRIGVGAWALAFGRALGLGTGPRPLRFVHWTSGGPDPNDLVATDDHHIPRVSTNPKSILASLNDL